METKDRIMQVTLELLLENGYDATSVSQITNKAGITKGALYYFFKNKEDLFEKVVVSFFDKYMSNIVASRINEASTIKEQVRRFYDVKHTKTYHESGQTDPQGHKNMYRLLQDGIDRYDKLDTVFKKFNDNNIKHQVNVLEEGKRQGIIRKDVNSRLLALSNMTYSRGVLRFVSGNIIDNVDEMIDEYFKIIWRSISIDSN